MDFRRKHRHESRWLMGVGEQSFKCSEMNKWQSHCIRFSFTAFVPLVRTWDRELCFFCAPEGTYLGVGAFENPIMLQSTLPQLSIVISYRRLCSESELGTVWIGGSRFSCTKERMIHKSKLKSSVKFECNFLCRNNSEDNQMKIPFAKNPSNGRCERRGMRRETEF